MDQTSVTERVAPRITILDAGELDDAIYAVMKSQKNIVTKYLPAWIVNKYELELDTLLRLGIWQLSVGKHKASFGQQLLHLKYNNKSRLFNLQILALLTIGGPYLKERLQSAARSSEDSAIKNVDNMLENVETLLKVLNILTLMRFLWKGGPPTFLEWLLRLTPVSTVPQTQRSVGYSYMTRELIWHGFIELLVILIPLINYHRIKRKFLKLLSGRRGSPVSNQKCVFNSTSICEICKDPPILPHGMGCAHVYCYFCISSNRESDVNYECPGCGYTNPDPTAVISVQSLLFRTSVSPGPRSEQN